MAAMDAHDTDTAASPDVIEARLATSFTVRSLVVAAVCLVLGVWGVLDYVEIIPTQERHFSRAEVCRAFKRAADPMISGSERPDKEIIVGFISATLDNIALEDGDGVRSEIEGLRSAVASQGIAAIDRLEPLLVSTLLPAAEQQAATAPNTDAPTSRMNWLRAEAAMVQGIRNPIRAGAISDRLRTGLQQAEVQLALYGETEQPSEYDRPVQWLFILCLPFVPWYIWNVIRNRRHVYRLNADGSLDLPGERWSSDDIADIDMGRWMRTSKAWLVHVDGRRVLLDDYVFKGVHRIVGVLASQRHPDTWTDEARPVKKQADADDKS